MGVKQYLQQVKRLDDIVNAKYEQIEALRLIATKITTYPRDVKVQTSPSNDRLEKIVVKIADLENELNSSIDKLVDLKAEITQRIDEVSNNDYRLLLALRYLNFKTWEQIANEMHYDVRWIHELHKRALAEFENMQILKYDSY